MLRMTGRVLATGVAEQLRLADFTYSDVGSTRGGDTPTTTAFFDAAGR